MTVAGCASRTPEEILAQARYELAEVEVNTQAAINTLSVYTLELARMERDYLELRLCNHPGYSAVSKDYHASREAWEKKFNATRNAPSEGSFGAYAANQDLLALKLRRIDELRTKWLKAADDAYADSPVSICDTHLFLLIYHLPEYKPRRFFEIGVTELFFLLKS